MKVAWREQPNFVIQLVCATVAVGLGFVVRISVEEWLAIILAIGLVLAAETFNTALEEFCDMVQSNHDPHVAKIKDLAAASVLIASSAAAVVGCVIFIPHIV